MSQTLADDLPDGSGTKALRVWLKSSGYARRLLLGESGDPWADGAAKYLSFFSQARGLLRADVAEVDLGDLFRSWVHRHPALRADMASKKRATYPLRRMLEEEGPRQLLDEVTEAVAANLQAQVPMVLAMPAPGAWLAEAQQMVDRPAEVDEDAVEDAAMYMADFLRCVSARPVGGLLLEEGVSPGPANRYSPILNAAKHYRWAVVGRDVAPEAEAVFDATIGTDASAKGRDVSIDLFGQGTLPAIGSGQFAFAEIPVGHAPEAVLDAIAQLRG